MVRIWAVGEPNADSSLARVSTEVATVARSLAEEAEGEVAGVVIAADPREAAEELARFVPRVLAITEAGARDHVWATIAAERVALLAAERAPDLILTGAGPDGRDFAGVLSALLGWGVVGNATRAYWDGGPRIEKDIFGGKLHTTCGFRGQNGIVTVRPNVVKAVPADAHGSVEPVNTQGSCRLPAVRVVERVVEPGAVAPIEEAKIVVVGGRGVAGSEGFRLVEEVAHALGGAVGATRPPVDAGWISYAHQIGQTGKTVRPELYLGLGVSGALQHKVGMQTAEAIVAVDRDPDAPIAEFADLFVVGDLFEVGSALLAELRARPRRPPEGM